MLLLFLFVLTWNVVGWISSIENQKGVITIQQYSIENQKGIIAIEYLQR